MSEKEIAQLKIEILKQVTICCATLQPAQPNAIIELFDGLAQRIIPEYFTTPTCIIK